ncbi:MAG: hypothetical protein R3D71_06555 [Rickettsiales bacterium]
MRPEINNQSKNIEDPSNKGTDISFQNTGTKKPEPSILQDKRLYPFFAATAISIGSVLVKDKNGISYAQRIIDKITDSPISKQTMGEPTNSNLEIKLPPSKNNPILNIGAVFVLSYSIISLLGMAANKLYNSTISKNSDKNINRN